MRSLDLHEFCFSRSVLTVRFLCDTRGLRAIVYVILRRTFVVICVRYEYEAQRTDDARVKLADKIHFINVIIFVLLGSHRNVGIWTDLTSTCVRIWR